MTLPPRMWEWHGFLLQGIVKVGAVDADQHQSLGGRFGVRGFPTIKVIRDEYVCQIN